MNNLNKILLASHGTVGAQAAVTEALALCKPGATLHHFIVVPEFWKNMMGDDWLNNGISRDRYARYLESELGQEVDQHIKQVREQAEAKDIQYQHEIQLGEPYKCLISTCLEHSFDLVVMGSIRPKGVEGVNSKMALDKLSGKLNTPLLIIPFPQQ